MEIDKVAARSGATPGRAWERLAGQRHRRVCFKVIGPRTQEITVDLGAHAPHLTEEDINLIHWIWLDVSKLPARRKVHHRDVVRVALDRLHRDLRGQTDVMLDFYRLEHNGNKNGKKEESISIRPSQAESREATVRKR